MRSLALTLLPLLSGLLLAACSLQTSATVSDAGARLTGDSGEVPGDAARGDAEALDTAVADGARRDSAAMATDSSAPDARAADTAPMDSGAPDTAIPSCTTPAPGTDEAVGLPAPGGITIDGDLSDWTWARWESVGPADWVGRSAGPPTGDADHSARVAFQWTAGALYVAAIVTDDAHFNDRTGWPIWEGDSFQVAFDVGHDGSPAYDATDDYEYGWARTGTGTERYRWHAPSGAPVPSDDVAVVRGTGTTTYEIRFAPPDLGVGAFAAGDRLGLSWLVNELDGGGASEGYLRWTAGIGETKSPALFGDLVLRACD